MDKRSITEQLANVRLDIDILQVLVSVGMEQAQCAVQPD